MKTSQKAPANIDKYIEGFSPRVQDLLQTIRRTLRKAAPDAEEVISYRMPAFRLNGILVYFAAFKSHIGFYPTANAIRHFRKELAGYEGAKGTVRFPLDEPLPLGLIRKIVKFRVAENMKKQKTRR
jgi:uncharacterized protein YdhG (YjbR/CyaY superfamily)